MDLDRLARRGDVGTKRARAIVAALIATGRARVGEWHTNDDDENYIRAKRVDQRGYYWVRRDGQEIRSGFSFLASDVLQPGFADRLLSETGRQIPPASPAEHLSAPECGAESGSD